MTAEYIFFGGKRVAMLPAGSTAIYYVEDLLGTSRVTTTNTGVVCYDADFYPYGGERTPYTNTCTQNNYKFEGKERDTETGNDDFGARYYSNRFGRWLSADWSSVPVPVPYANLTNPQTLNLYSMVADDPESFADLDGHEQQQSQGGAEGQCGGGTGNTSGNSCAKQPAQAQNQQTTAETPRRDDLIAVRSSTKVESAQPFYALTADVQYTIVDAKTLKTQANPEGVQLQEKLAPGADPSVAKNLIHGNNPAETCRTLTDAVYITPGLMKQTYALKQQILVGGKAVQIFDRNSNGALTGGRWVNVQSVIQGKFFYQGTEWKPGNTY